MLQGIKLDSKSLVHIASLPNLLTLDAPLSALQTSREILPLVPFPALKNIHAYFSCITDADGFFKRLSSSSRLESIAVDVSTISPFQQLRSFLTTVHQRCSHDTLTSFSLDDSGEMAVDALLPHSIEADVLTPLLQFPNLENVCIHIHYGYDTIDNSLILDMALAWPHLRKISLGIYHQAHWRSKIDLESLLHLAQHCRTLESVKYEFDVSLPTTSIYSGERLGNGIRNESTTHLSVGRSSITDPAAVAALLSNVFPNLMLLHTWHLSESWYYSDDEEDPEFIETCKRWAEVDELLTITRQQNAS